MRLKIKRLDPAVGLLHLDVDPRVRIDPLHLRHRALQLHRLSDVILGGEGVVREHRMRGKSWSAAIGDACLQTALKIV